MYGLMYPSGSRVLGGCGSVVLGGAHNGEAPDRLEWALGVLHGETVGDAIPVDSSVSVPELDGNRVGGGGEWAADGGSVRARRQSERHNQYERAWALHREPPVVSPA